MACDPIDLTALIQQLKDLGPLRSTVDGHSFTRESIKDLMQAQIMWDKHCKKNAVADAPHTAIARQRIKSGRGRNC